MIISIGAIILALTSLFLFIKNIKTFKYVFISLFFLSIISGIVLDSGYFAMIGNTEIEYNYFFSIILLPISIITIIRYRRQSSIPLLIILFTISVSISAILASVTNRQTGSIAFTDLWDNYFNYQSELPVLHFDKEQFFKMFIRQLLFFFNIWAFYCVADRKIINKAIKNVVKVSYVIVFIYLVEIITDNFVSPIFFRTIIFNIFGKGTSVYETPRKIFNIYVPLLFNSEPSGTGFTLFVLGINSILAYKYFKKKTNIFLCVFFLLALLVSMSFSSLIYIFLMLLIIFAISKQKFTLGFIYLAVGVFLGFAVLSLYSERINNIFTNLSLFKQGINYLPKESEIIRLYSIYNNLQIFFKYPLFGVGLGTSYSFSGFFTTLCNIGLIGTILWTKIVFTGMKRLHVEKTSLVLSSLVFFVAFLFSGHMGIMTYLDKSFYLFVIITLTFNKKKEHVSIVEYIAFYPELIR